MGFPGRAPLPCPTQLCGGPFLPGFLPTTFPAEVHYRLWGSEAVKGDVGVPTGLGRFPGSRVPAPFRGSFLVSPRCSSAVGGSWPLKASQLADGPVRKLGLEAGTWHPAVPGQRSWGKAPGPGSSSSSHPPLSAFGPQPETEDEKRRFEEGKGRYLQMKAKRRGQAEPQS